ncbi:MAG: formimidoylglutamate deiminase, partial [Actinomycetota bacterium]
MTSTYHADLAWRGGDSAVANVRFEVANGVIASVTDGVAMQAGDEHIAGVVMPGLVNAHSHAFHRALRGRTHGGGGDFWSWRRPMYDIANALTPENYAELSALVYAEMALAGITGVGEFHYVHHDRDGSAYNDPNEMGLAVVQAADRAGIRLALLDVAYLHAGLDQSDPLPEQRRFADRNIESWLDRVDRLGEGGNGWTVGLAPHSVRAVHPDELDEVVGARYGRVVHLHVSEQPAENLACLAVTGKTPTAVLAEVGLLGPFATAVHATHLTRGDIELLGTSKTTACMCPTTERDLADGIGPASALVRAGAMLAFGSDSHATIDLFEEARAVEYNERLIAARRG